MLLSSSNPKSAIESDVETNSCPICNGGKLISGLRAPFSRIISDLSSFKLSLLWVIDDLMSLISNSTFDTVIKLLSFPKAKYNWEL